MIEYVLDDGIGFPRDWFDGLDLAIGPELGNVLVDRRAADSQQPGDRGDGRVRLGEQRAGVPGLLGRHRGRAAEALTVGAGGIQALEGVLDDELADELRQRGEHV